ncbi:hypothetical protein EAJ29_08010 [Campylobacter upsaliensis]|nr:hypothetical protein [Campylobacter upsaliensis]
MKLCFKRPFKKRLKLCYNPKKLAGSFSLTLIALISYLFLNAENLIFLKAKFKAKQGKGVSLWDGLGFSFFASALPRNSSHGVRTLSLERLLLGGIYFPR